MARKRQLVGQTKAEEGRDFDFGRILTVWRDGRGDRSHEKGLALRAAGSMGAAANACRFMVGVSERTTGSAWRAAFVFLFNFFFFFFLSSEGTAKPWQHVETGSVLNDW